MASHRIGSDGVVEPEVEYEADAVGAVITKCVIDETTDQPFAAVLGSVYLAGVNMRDRVNALFEPDDDGRPPADKRKDQLLEVIRSVLEPKEQYSFYAESMLRRLISVGTVFIRCARSSITAATAPGNLAILLRAGNAGANTAADHITVTRQALAQLPSVIGHRVGKSVLVRTDSAGGTHEFLDYLRCHRLAYSVGFGLSETIATIIDNLHEQAWTPAYDADGIEGEGAWAAELLAFWTSQAGPKGCASSPAKSAHTQGRSCATPTPTACD